MDQPLKERLVGAAVLALLAVLLVPVILDGPEDAHTTRDIPLPPADTAAVPEQTYRFDLQTRGSTPVQTDQREPVATTEQPADTPQPEATGQTATTEPARQSVTDTPPPASTTVEGWTVQVGSFSTQARATHLRDELRGKDFKAFIVPFKDGNQQYYRVRVGPEASRAAAEALAKRLQAETGSAVRVVSPP